MTVHFFVVKFTWSAGRTLILLWDSLETILGMRNDSRLYDGKTVGWQQNAPNSYSAGDGG